MFVSFKYLQSTTETTFGVLKTERRVDYTDMTIDHLLYQTSVSVVVMSNRNKYHS